MKVTTIIGTAIATVGLAACGSTVAPTERPATPTPTVAPTPTTTPAPTPTATPIPTPSPSDSPSPSASALPDPSASPCVPTTDGPFGTGSCEDTPVVTVTACDRSGGETAATGGAISWSGADSVDSFWIWPPGNGGYPIKLYQGSGNLPLTPSSGSYGPLVAGAYTYQFVDNTNEIFNGSFTIVTCAVPNAYTDTFPRA